MFGLFGDNDDGFFGKAFDFDHDGHLDPLERAADFGMFMEMIEEDEREDNYRSSSFDSDDYDDYDDWDEEDDW